MSLVEASNDGGEPPQEENNQQPSPVKSSTIATPNREVQPSHQRLVFADPAAFRYLEEDPSTTVLARRHRLQGYELYLVEQWACSRVHPTFVITTYTGLEQHSVLVSVLSVPTDEDAWSPRLRVYLKAITKFHARKKETPLGTLMVTNLSGFPSALTVVAVPDGDIRAHRADFIVNENLKRMGCSGRAGLKLSPPISATQATFARLYKTSDRLPVYSAVIELVKLCQVALMLFGKLAPEYADGLLCDVTEQAINDWWTEIGTEFFNVDPTDGILGPTTVAALLGLLLGARNRLHACGAPVGKDVFDLPNTKRGIVSFQKSQKMELEYRTRRLDRQTLNRLHKASAKAASGQGWTVPRAVKSTVAELSGKGGDVVMGMVGGRDKIGIAEVETLDIDTFVQLVYGERCKWLWHGKPPKNIETDLFSDAGFDDGKIFSKNEHGGYTWSTTRRDSVLDDYSRHDATDRAPNLPAPGSQTNHLDLASKDLALRRTVLKSVTGKMTDARSGLGRIKEAVGKTGLRGHYHKYSKDGNVVSDADSITDTPIDKSTSKLSDLWSSQQETKPTNDEGAVGYPLNSRRGSSIPDNSSDTKKEVQILVPDTKATETDAESISSLDSDSRNLRLEDHRLNHFPRPNKANGNSNTSLNSLQTANPQDASNLPSRKSSWKKHFPPEYDPLPLLRSTKSLSQLQTRSENSHHEHRWPRHLSFSAVVDVVAAGTDPDTDRISDAGKSPDAVLAFEESLVMSARSLEARLQDLRTKDSSLVERKVEEVNDFDTQYAQDQDRLHHMYRQKLEEFDGLRDTSVELIAEEKKSLTETIKDVDNLGAKLEYELTSLYSKVEDVENGVAEFERQVLEIERRAEDLHEDKTDKNSWLWWTLGFFARTTKHTDWTPSL
ncbi:hypothetical protein MMC07_008634 [Pseudocyphellaria aurata]|nr:hypothetical protein [Pseudocyphellaria aurata]